MREIFFAIFMLFVIYNSFARDVEVLVEDSELGLPLEGAVIRSWDGRQYTCGKDGRADVSVPDDRQVVIQAAYPGYENGRLVITAGNGAYKIGLRLSGVMESRELVIEAERPGTSETKTGRSVAVSGRDIAQTAEIGIIEDVMSSVKLLPGVGYAGFFDAQPSIRGGFPGDMNASLDGYYIMNPYHWGGGFSIFDPRMVQSAQLSHGVFSTRYGHTISGLLDISSKKPSPIDAEFEIGAGTSAANFNISLPFANKGSLVNKGGILFMGRVTYYDPVVFMVQKLGKVYQELGIYTQETVDALNAIRVAPYIRSGTVTGNYRFADNLELNATGFFGADGIGVTYNNESPEENGLSSSSRIALDWTNYQGFITAALKWNPRNDMLAKFSIGTGFEDAVVDADMQSSVKKDKFSDDFFRLYPELKPVGLAPSPYNTRNAMQETDLMYNAQARADYDWEPGKGFLLAAGAQEMFTMYSMKGDQQGAYELSFAGLKEEDQAVILNLIPAAFPGVSLDQLSDQFLRDLRISHAAAYSPNAENFLFTTSGYGLVEYAAPDKRFGAELGLRVDHYYLLGDGFSYGTEPALNPRLSMDFNALKDLWILESLDISAGTGLFSTVDNNVFMAEEQYEINDVKPNRSWTSVLGTKITFPEGLSFNIEGYYKYIFNRMYIPVGLGLNGLDVRPQFDGKGKVWGIDLMLQKLQSRYWDGWLSYSYSWAKYRDPSSDNADMGISGGTRGNDWYYPNFHRFHNLNLVVNVKPAPEFNIYTRFGLASGTQIPRRTAGGPTPYPVLMYDNSGASGGLKLVQRYYWPSVTDENNRTTPTLTMDLKFSYFGKNRSGKTRYEIYLAIENVLSLVYTEQGNTSFNSYTGVVDTGSNSASYGLPIPIPSFGFKLSY
jgi:hypothetical protein